MELKLKKRELKVTLYDGEVLVMGYPTKKQHDEYIEGIVKDVSKETELTKELYSALGMSGEVFESIEQPDLYEIGLFLTGQKKS